jgi:protein phosphatase
MIVHPFNFAMLSHPGRVRKGNEDTCAAAIELGAFVVCDGMGGAAGGEVASRLASDAFLASLAQRRDRPAATSNGAVRRLEAAIHAANQAVFQYASRSPELRGMGTTLVGLLHERRETGGSALTLAHVGDSRCYRLRAGELTLLTQDHSLVEEQVRSGELTPDQAQSHPWRNIITRAVGSHSQVEGDIQELEPIAGDLYLLASDGLTRELDDRTLGELLTRELRAAPRQHVPSGESEPTRNGATPPAAEPAFEVDLASLCQTLVEQANLAGGGDNITVVLVEIK